MPLLRSQLHEARSSAGLTQRELAQLIGVQQPHIARWETGDHVPRVDKAIRLARALETTVEALWGMDERA